MNKNIFLSYLLVFFKNSWFWLGVWVFYYLRYTNYAGIGIIETVLIITMTMAEIPTGAIADLIGKKKTLFFSFLIQAIGNVMFGLSSSFIFLVFSVFVSAIGAALFSGTLEALVYDTLKQDNQQAKYDKKIANINTIQLIAPAICGALGGLMYMANPRLPFFASGVFYLLGCVVTIFLTEPIIDTIRFSASNYVLQIKQGFKQLTKTNDITNQTILLLSIGVIVVIIDEMLNSFLGVEFGLKAGSMGILWAVIYVVSALASQTIPLLNKRLGQNNTILFSGGIIAITMLLSPLLGLVFGGLSLLVRSSSQSIYWGLTSIAINNNTESKYRATTISTFNMIRNIPYVLCAFFIGTLSDKYSAKGIAFFLGALLLLFLIIQLLRSKMLSKHIRISHQP